VLPCGGDISRIERVLRWTTLSVVDAGWGTCGQTGAVATLREEVEGFDPTGVGIEGDCAEGAASDLAAVASCAGSLGARKCQHFR